MDRPLKHSPIQIRPSLLTGRGVFAEKKIRKGDIIEECPVLLLTEECKSIKNYYFQWSEKPWIYAIPLGFALLYNHADAPNADWRVDPGQNLMVIRALYDISADDEIFIDYGDNWFKARKMVKAHYRNKRFKRYLGYFIKSAIVILIIFALRWIETHTKISMR